MASKSNYVADAPLSEQERQALGDARDLLKKYGQYVDVADMSDVAYEQRNCRMKALDVVAAVAKHVDPGTRLVVLADEFYRFIWGGEVESEDGDGEI